MAGFWRFCMVLVFCLLPLPVFACNGAGMVLLHHDVAMTASSHDGSRHSHTQGDNMMPCCVLCPSVPFVTVNAELAGFIPVQDWYSPPMQVLAGIRTPPLLQPPPFS
ncbi:MAG: Hypothetical protein BHV28_08940 [Candidatus Tokpelaia hoelldobleri]|uniref:DUF2946 domain-containing protein n=1 Tax=Candidatus Tokpelaia hoelldobleri TaxID=1902579 RepID=A0A1U9JUR2_9HYPH|nr:MAG: Hypothetical protein BHV28_08940 [Candidatus Tokpelaia hoelldoblerii]